MRIIGYSKLGRSFNLDISKASVAGGDIDVIRGLSRLARQFPDDQVLILGRNSGENPQEVGLPENVVNFWTDERRLEFKERSSPRNSPMTREQQQRVLDVFADMTTDSFRSCDHHIVWAGQHGTSNSPLPPIKDRDKPPTNPQDAFVLYCYLILNGINAWRDVDPLRREEVWLVPDPRNYLKFRDARWPLQRPVIAQYEMVRKTKHERYGDMSLPSEHGFPEGRAWFDPDEPGLWKSHVDYVYGALELTALGEPSRIKFDLDAPRLEFGIISNENRTNVSRPRAPLIKSWVVDQFPEAPIHGIWSAKGQELLGRAVEPVPYTAMLPTMRTFRATCTFPASGSFWATAKPWEAFASGTICFFAPNYDKQNHILGDNPYLLKNLRVDSPEQLKMRVDRLSQDYELYRYLATKQREHFERRFEETQGGMRFIFTRLAG